jgi:uncharacterized protein YqgV (UPF0045/DUF77 family)
MSLVRRKQSWLLWRREYGGFGNVGVLVVMEVSAQISVYPLRQEKLGPTIDTMRDILEAQGLSPQVGAMSTIVTGDSETVFSALREAFEAAAAKGDTVVTITVSNACPT